MNTERMNDSKAVLAYAGAAISADGTILGASIDTKDFSSLTIALDYVRVTDGQIDSIGFQESDDNSVWADAPDSLNLYVKDEFPAALTGISVVGSISKKRYVKLKMVFTGFSSGSITIPKTLAILQDGYTKPTNDVT